MYDFNDIIKLKWMLGMCILIFLVKKKKKIFGIGMFLD